MTSPPALFARRTFSVGRPAESTPQQGLSLLIVYVHGGFPAWDVGYARDAE